MQEGTLWLLPSTLGSLNIADVIPEAVLQKVRSLRYFLVEEPKTARAFLKSAGHPVPIAELRIEQLTNDTPREKLISMLEHVRSGTDAGVLSEAGCPAIADPGAPLVRLAHSKGIRVVPMTGPSSLILALMASGLETQRFAFHGYLPIKEPARSNAIKTHEKRSSTERETQIFIETPYRNRSLLEALLKICKPDTLLCVACDLTMETESIQTLEIRAWRSQRVELDKRPCVFLFLAQPVLA